MKENMLDFDGQTKAGESHIGLFTLPNEILIYVLEHISDDEQIWPVTLVSRRLHHLALSIYLSRKACGPRPFDQLITSNYNARDAFKAIRAALFRPSLSSLYFTIDCYKSDAALQEEIEGLVDSLRKLSSLGEMVINFQRIVTTSSGPVDVSRQGEYGFPGGLTCASLAILLEAVTEVRCRTVTIRHCGCKNSDFHRLEDNLEWQFGGGIILSLLRKMSGSLATPSTLPPSMVKNSALTSFRLHSHMAFHPYIYRWTLDALNHSALTCLSISQHYGTSNRVWELVLPQLHLPMLLDLSIDFTHVKIDIFFQFLRRHNCIQTLRMGHCFTTNGSAKVKPSLLNHLTNLVAPVVWINRLLSSSESLPTLAVVTVLTHVAGGSFSVIRLEGALKPSLPRLASLKELFLSIMSVGAPYPELALPKQGLGGNSPLYRLIIGIDISVKLYTVPPLLVATLPRWLSLFQRLRRFELHALTNEPGCALERAELVNAIQQARPEIESVRFRTIKDDIFMLL